jgi:hypothetical protein
MSRLCTCDQNPTNHKGSGGSTFQACCITSKEDTNLAESLPTLQANEEDACTRMSMVNWYRTLDQHLNKRAQQNTWHNCSDMRARIHVALLLQQPVGGCTGCTKRWQGAEAPEAAVIRVHDYVLKCAHRRHQSYHCTGC